MSFPRTSNQERAKWRTQCRKKLADHIYSQLGIAVLPADVKLITKPEDPYQWSVLTADKITLFKKQLSKLSTGAYIDLCNGVGQHFEAVLGEGVLNYEQTRRSATTCVAPNTLERSLPIVHTAISNYTHRDIEILQVAAEEWRGRADAELTRREALEEKLTRAESENAELSNQIKTLREVEATQTRDIEKIREILFRLSQMLQEQASKTYEDSQQVTRVAEYLQLRNNPRIVVG